MPSPNCYARRGHGAGVVPIVCRLCDEDHMPDYDFSYRHMEVRSAGRLGMATSPTKDVSRRKGAKTLEQGEVRAYHDVE